MAVRGIAVIDTDLGFDKFQANLTALAEQRAFLTVGIHADAGSEVIIIAATNEFGTTRAGVNHNITIPERSFMRSTLDENQRRLFDALQKAIEDDLDDKRPLKDGLGLVGELTVSLIKNKVRDRRIPPNAPSTIAKKGSDNPLIDTSQNIRNRIDWRLEIE